MAEKIKRISRKDISKMSTADFIRSAKVPYRRLLGYIKPYRARFAAGVVFGVASGMFNLVLLFVFKFVFHIVLGSGDVGPDEKPFNQFSNPFGGDPITIPVPDVTGDGGLIIVLLICGLIPLMILIRGMLGYLHQYCMFWVGNKILYQLRDETFTSLMRQSHSFYNRIKLGELIQTVYNQTRLAQTASTQIASDIIKHPVSIVSIVAFLLMQDPLYALAALVVFPLCLLPVLAVSKKVRSAGGREEEEAGMLMVTMQESFAGIGVVKAHAREEYERKKFNDGSMKIVQFIMRWRKAMEIVGPLVETVASMGMAAGLVYAWATHMTAQDFILLNMALMGMYPHAKALSKIQIQLQKAIVATTRVFAIMDEEPDITDAPDAAVLKDARGDIAFKDVSFAYLKGTPAVEEISANFEPGRTYALVGKSGAGKSTILSLLMRFYDPQTGSISVDGTDIRKITQCSLRDNIGLVSQDTFLFHDTIYANILYGKLDAKKKEIEEAARKAFAHDFIMLQPDGYQTVIGDKGCKLSGGQQQRISIARAFLRNAPILLLDEATSALDSESEREIQTALDLLGQGKTVIAIAHRLSTILKSDKIILMDRGRILDAGPHHDLLDKSEDYRNLYNLQFHFPHPDDVEEGDGEGEEREE